MITIKKNRIKKALRGYPYKIRFKRKCTSTNDEIKTKKDFTVLISLCQTKGKGTRGRAFFSPKNKGVYFSVLLKDKAFSDKYITPMSAVAVTDALATVSGEDFGIKWVNDIYLRDKKVCGILAEKGEYGLVVGVGINLEQPDDGYGEYNDVATSVFKVAPENVAEKIVTEFLKRFYAYLGGEAFYSEYAKKCIVVKRRVHLSDGREAYCKNVNEDFSITVVFDDGKEEKIRTGDVSIKLK